VCCINSVNFAHFVQFIYLWYIAHPTLMLATLCFCGIYVPYTRVCMRVYGFMCDIYIYIYIYMCVCVCVCVFSSITWSKNPVLSEFIHKTLTSSSWRYTYVVTIRIFSSRVIIFKLYPSCIVRKLSWNDCCSTV
jgi:hypothetical protein